MNTSDKLALTQIADLDGDGLNDLCYTADDDGNRGCACGFKLPTAGGAGVGLRFEPPAVGDLGRVRRQARQRDFRRRFPHQPRERVEARTPGRQERGTVLSADSIRLRRVRGWPRPRNGDRRHRRRRPVGCRRHRSLRRASFFVFRQHKRQGLDSGTTYPALVGATQVRIAQFGKGPASVIVLSPHQKTMGVSKFEDGRLTFPTSMPLPIEPLAFEVTDLDGDRHSRSPVPR